MSSFEFSNKGDEWLDVTTKEELLQRELDRVKGELETRSMELLESNVTIDLLKGHKTLLENERESLKAKLEQSKDAFGKVSKELKDTIKRKEFLKKEFAEMKTGAELHGKKLEQALVSCKKELEHVYAEYESLSTDTRNIKKEYQKEREISQETIDDLTNFVEQLKYKVSVLEKTAEKEHEGRLNLEKELMASRAREEDARRLLAKTQKEVVKRNSELKETQKRIGTVAILAENLKSKNASLERSLTTQAQAAMSTKKELENSAVRENSLRKEIQEVKAASLSEVKKLEQALDKSFKEISDSNNRVATLEGFVDALKQQNSTLGDEREKLEETLALKEVECQDVLEEKFAIEEKFEKDTRSLNEELQKARDTLAQEKDLRDELERQKFFLVSRLREVRAILGVTAVSEIMSEIMTVTRRDTLTYPSIGSVSLGIPLLAHMKLS